VRHLRLEGVIARGLQFGATDFNRWRSEQRCENSMGAATLRAVGRAVLAGLIGVAGLAIPALIGGRKAALRSDRLNHPGQLDRDDCHHDRK
jgi:hypothetical protein